MSVQSEAGLSTTMAYSTAARTAFMNGTNLPPDDTVS